MPEEDGTHFLHDTCDGCGKSVLAVLVAGAKTRLWCPCGFVCDYRLKGPAAGDANQGETT